MVREEFKTFVEGRIAKIQASLASKGLEYIRGNDAFHNFKEAARIDDKSPLEALHGMWLKHYVSFRDMMKDANANQPLNPAQIDEKLGDMINYFILAEGILVEIANNQTLWAKIKDNGNSNTEQREAVGDRDNISESNTNINS